MSGEFLVQGAVVVVERGAGGRVLRSWLSACSQVGGLQIDAASRRAGFPFCGKGFDHCWATLVRIAGPRPSGHHDHLRGGRRSRCTV